MTATELAVRIRHRQLSAVEVVDAFIERIEQRNKSLNAFVYLGFEDARKRAKEAETEVYDAIQSILNKYDLLITPTLACLPVENASDGNTMGPTTINGEPVDPLIGWCLTYFVNFSGHPAASIPAGLAEGKLPVGMQIIGRRYADADVLAASATFERLRPWYESYKLCAARPL